MKETVLITGGSSFIARHLLAELRNHYALKLLTRTPKAPDEYKWDLERWTLDERALDDVAYIVHLSGAKLNDGSPLSPERKKLIYDTRIGAADFLRARLKARGQRLKAFLSASAVGYYGFTDSSLEIDENGNRGIGFNATLCQDWEDAAERFRAEQVAARVVSIRVPLVLGRDGGILPYYESMLQEHPQLPEQANPAAVPWNHVADMAGIFAYAVTHELDGVYNAVAPQAASAQDIFKAIAKQTQGKAYAIAPFRGQHLVSHKIIRAGYRFKYPDIETAIKNLHPITASRNN